MTNIRIHNTTLNNEQNCKINVMYLNGFVIVYRFIIWAGGIAMKKFIFFITAGAGVCLLLHKYNKQLPTNVK